MLNIDKQETRSVSGSHNTGAGGAAPVAVVAGDDPDERSIFVKNVHFNSTPEELKNHFNDCGEIKRVTIPVDKFT